MAKFGDVKKNSEYAIARKCIKEFVETKNFFSLYAIGQYIKEKGGVLRTSTGVSVKEYLDDLVLAKVLKRMPYQRLTGKRTRAGAEKEEDYMYAVLPEKKEEPKCPVCKSTNTSEMYEYPDAYHMPIGGRVNWHYMYNCCNECGVLFRPIKKTK